MRIVVLSLVALVITAASSRAQDLAPTVRSPQLGQNSEACSAEFWRRAVTVATGHGPKFEIEARQIGRVRCDCTFTIGKPTVCRASRVSEAEAIPPEMEQ
jgi:hypothetical protein